MAIGRWGTDKRGVSGGQVSERGRFWDGDPIITLFKYMIVHI